MPYTYTNTEYYSRLPLCVSSSCHYCSLSNYHPQSLVPPSQRRLRPSDCCNLPVLHQAAPKAPASEDLTAFPCEGRYLLRPGLKEVVRSSAQLKDCLGPTPSGSLPTEASLLLVWSFLGRTEGSPTQFQTCYHKTDFKKSIISVWQTKGKMDTVEKIGRGK